MDEATKKAVVALVNPLAAAEEALLEACTKVAEDMAQYERGDPAGRAVKKIRARLVAGDATNALARIRALLRDAAEAKAGA